ncbi:MAG: hypothetical protein WCS77_05170 [Elusimicrobiaceae bacterium]
MLKKSQIAVWVLFCTVLFNCASAQAATAIMGKYKTELYAWMKICSIYNAHGITGDDYVSYVNSSSPKDGDFSISARATRFGLNVADDEDKIGAKAEIDFLGLTDSVAGAASAGTNASPRIRHLYVTYGYKEFSFLAGQTWYLTPLELPDTTNDFFFGYSGALWFRAPQLRATWTPEASPFSFAVAAVRPTRKLTDAEGTASKMPSMQGQIQAKLGTVKLTLAGALGQWKNSTYQTGDVRLVDLGFNIPYGIFTFNGQLWTGENLYDFLGGIGNMGYDGNEVKASGGFVDLKIKPRDWLYFNAVYGIDNPQDAKLAVGDRKQNSTIMGNVNFVLNKKITLSFETSYILTEYKLANDGTDRRGSAHYQLAVIYPF